MEDRGEVQLPGDVFIAVGLDARLHALRQRRRGVGFGFAHLNEQTRILFGRVLNQNRDHAVLAGVDHIGNIYIQIAGEASVVLDRINRPASFDRFKLTAHHFFHSVILLVDRQRQGLKVRGNGREIERNVVRAAEPALAADQRGELHIVVLLADGNRHRRGLRAVRLHRELHNVVLLRGFGLAAVEVQVVLAGLARSEGVAFRCILLRAAVDAHLVIAGEVQLCKVAAVSLAIRYGRILIVNANGRVGNFDAGKGIYVRGIIAVSGLDLRVADGRRGILARAPIAVALESQIALVLGVHVLIVEVGVHLVGNTHGDEHAETARRVGLLGGGVVRRFFDRDGKLRVFAVGVGRADGHGVGAVRRQIVGVDTDARIVIREARAVDAVGIGQRVAVRIAENARQIGLPIRDVDARAELAGALGRILHDGRVVFDRLAGDGQRVGVGPDEGRSVLFIELQRIDAGICKRPAEGHALDVAGVDEFLVCSVDGDIDGHTVPVFEDCRHGESERRADSDLRAAGLQQKLGLRLNVQSNGVGFIGIGLAVVRGELQRRVDRSAYIAVFFRRFHRVGAVDGDLIGQRVTVRVGKNRGEIKLPGNAFKAVLFDALFHALRQRRRGVSLCGERCGGQKPENHQRGQQKGQ